MSVRSAAIECPECKERLAWGELADEYDVNEIKLSDSVLSAKRLYHGILSGNFFSAANHVVHSVVNGQVQHTID